MRSLAVSDDIVSGFLIMKGLGYAELWIEVECSLGSGISFLLDSVDESSGRFLDEDPWLLK